MSKYHHFNISEREMLLRLRSQGYSICECSKRMGKNKGTISRELKRNTEEGKSYLPSIAQEKYEERRKFCIKKKKLSDPIMCDYVKSKMLLDHSPEQISGRLKLENKLRKNGGGVDSSIPNLNISFSTIYRAINNRELEDKGYKKGRKGIKVHLRCKGKKYHKKDKEERRGKFKVGKKIDERPKEAEEKSKIGHEEGDTVIGIKKGKCIVTSVDRKSKFLTTRIAESKSAKAVTEAMIEMYKGKCIKSVTLDRGKEFSSYEEIERELGINIFFAYPHHPWERGLNENTNGLLRQYIAKGEDIGKINELTLQEYTNKINNRPRKTLGYRTPEEVYRAEMLHLV